MLRTKATQGYSLWLSWPRHFPICDVISSLCQWTYPGSVSGLWLTDWLIHSFICAGLRTCVAQASLELLLKSWTLLLWSQDLISSFQPPGLEWNWIWKKENIETVLQTDGFHHCLLLQVILKILLHSPWLTLKIRLHLSLFSYELFIAKTDKFV